MMKHSLVPILCLGTQYWKRPPPVSECLLENWRNLRGWSLWGDITRHSLGTREIDKLCREAV